MAEDQAADRAERESAPDTWDGKAIADWMSTPHGRHLMARFLDECGIGGRRYQFDGDGLGMAWRDGFAAAGQFWQTLLLTHCPDLYMRMIRERRTQVARQQAKMAAEAARREGPSESKVTMTGVEAAADQQRDELEAEEQRAKADADKRAKRAKKD